MFYSVPKPPDSLGLFNWHMLMMLNLWGKHVDSIKENTEALQRHE
jgi:hypothetical protein